MPNVVTNEAEAVAREIEDQLEARDIQGLGFLALAGATGVIIAQEVTERVLPLLNMNREPQSATEFAAAGGIKIVFALGIGVLAAQMSGLALAFLAFHAVGAVVFAGADFVNAIQRSGLAAETTRNQASPTTQQSASGSGNADRRQPNQAGLASSNGSQSTVA